MKYFDTYVSNTVAAGGNQTLFFTDGSPRTGRIFYRIAQPGRFNYSLLFSNIIDSTFSDGSISRKNRVVDSWEILSAHIGRCKTEDFEAAGDFVTLTFDGKENKEVAPGEFFSSDPVSLEFDAGEYLCFELTCAGFELPYHAESILPAFVKSGENWVYDRQIPFPSMVGVDRRVKKRVCYIGDSITQGCGTPVNGYAHWNAVLSYMLPGENAYWNMGLGFARADDAASNGAWLFKAKQNDFVAVCFGVNDIQRGFSAPEIEKNLAEIVDLLHGAGAKVLVQTVPPFDYSEEHTAIWRQVNAFIRTELSKKADAIFDCVPVLSAGGADCPTARYGGHPNVEGCRTWALALKPAMEAFISK